jgi:hypothetical protein
MPPDDEDETVCRTVEGFTMSTLRNAFKEWAVICRALAEGRQALVLRKGGVAEAGDTFQVEHTRFWLYPTYAHQQASALKPAGQALLPQVEANRPPSGFVRLTHWAEVGGVLHLQNLVAALKLDELHLWTRETVQARFAYRAPGLYALPLRVWKAAQPAELPETAYYSGCKSWVELERELPTVDSTPVLDDAAFRALLIELEQLLEPTALA